MPPKTVLLVTVSKVSLVKLLRSIIKLYASLEIVNVFELSCNNFFWHKVEYLSSSTKDAVDTDPRRAVSLLLRQAGGQGL